MFKKYIHLLAFLLSMSLAAGLQGATLSSTQPRYVAGVGGIQELFGLQDRLSGPTKRAIIRAKRHLQQRRAGMTEADIARQEADERRAQLKSLEASTAVMPSETVEGLDEAEAKSLGEGIRAIKIKCGSVAVDISAETVAQCAFLTTALSQDHEVTEIDLTAQLSTYPYASDIQTWFDLFKLLNSWYVQEKMLRGSLLIKDPEKYLYKKIADLFSEKFKTLNPESLIGFYNFCDYLGATVMLHAMFSQKSTFLVDGLARTVIGFDCEKVLGLLMNTRLC